MPEPIEQFPDSQDNHENLEQMSLEVTEYKYTDDAFDPE
jgi:hypothetical protein